MYITAFFQMYNPDEETFIEMPVTLTEELKLPAMHQVEEIVSLSPLSVYSPSSLPHS